MYTGVTALTPFLHQAADVAQNSERPRPRPGGHSVQHQFSQLYLTTEPTHRLSAQLAQGTTWNLVLQEDTKDTSATEATGALLVN